jgi:hypothetical protein
MQSWPKIDNETNLRLQYIVVGSYPLVLAASIKLKYSHGLGRFFGFTLLINCVRMIRDEKLQMPPPSREAKVSQGL